MKTFKKENEYELLIREYHLDSYGHVNNATYLQLYEEARWEISARRGVTYNTIQEKKQGFVILDINITFLSELHLRQQITINQAIVTFEGKTGKLKQQMIKPDGTIASELTMTFGLFDLENRKLIEPDAFWRQAWKLNELDK